ncbi:hypothetical protein POL68_42095 [Stigmatella sp. ncwal1]|uniref:Uncharacterized protein n=1 Tax=Stigmatella ashevillensis TaxID=2995309 RepID=A0ABT5DPP5_9BACT|nr:hypothetical protein [Stigmatella ashevillena]MDC0715115.1 hypothetical protein [Stigmatella ashevillena]
MASADLQPPIVVHQNGQPQVYGTLKTLLDHFKSTPGLTERATCFFSPSGSGNIAVLGWDHAMVIKRLQGRYCVTDIYAHFGKTRSSPAQPIFGHVSLGRPIERLDSGRGVSNFSFHPHPCKSCKGECRWVRVALPQPVHIDRVVTFQASSCSVCILHHQNNSEIVISHMDDGPPIPVGHIYRQIFGPPTFPLHVIASVFPDFGEMQKVAQSCAVVGAEPIFFRRGPMTPDGSSAYLGWSNLESGILFPPAAPCATFLGVVGAAQVYKTAIVKELLRYGPSRTLVPTAFQGLRGWTHHGLRLDHILHMTEHELTNLSVTLHGTQFGLTHLFLANQIGLALFALNRSGSELPRLKSANETSYSAAGLRALLIYAHISDGVKNEKLIAEVVELIETLTPLLQFAFAVPLNPATRQVMREALGRLRRPS